MQRASPNEHGRRTIETPWFPMANDRKRADWRAIWRRYVTTTTPSVVQHELACQEREGATNNAQAFGESPKTLRGENERHSTVRRIPLINAKSRLLSRLR